MTRRSKLETYIELLEIIKAGVEKPTRIMYKANVSWVPLRRMLNSLVEQGLVVALDAQAIKKRTDPADKRTHTIYRITQKGEDTLRVLAQGKDMIDVGT